MEGKQVYRLSGNLMIWPDEGQMLKFQKKKKEGERPRVQRFSSAYWWAFCDNAEELKDAVDNRIRTVLHVDTADKDSDGGKNYRFTVDFYDNGEIFVGLHFDGADQGRALGGINLTPSEFDCLVGLKGLINSSLVKFPPLRSSIKRPAMSATSFDCEWGPGGDVSPKKKNRTHDLLSAMNIADINHSTSRFLLPEGQYSDWFMFEEMCRDEIKKVFPEKDAQSVQIHKMEDGNGNVVSILNRIISVMLYERVRKRARELCNGCQEEDQSFERDVQETLGQGRSDLTPPPQIGFAGIHFSGCLAPAVQLLDAHLLRIKEKLRIDFVTEVCAKFFSMYGGGYNFEYTCFAPLCNGMYFMSRSESVAVAVESSPVDDQERFRNAVRYAEKCVADCH